MSTKPKKTNRTLQREKHKAWLEQRKTARARLQADIERPEQRRQAALRVLETASGLGELFNDLAETTQGSPHVESVTSSMVGLYASLIGVVRHELEVGAPGVG